MADDANTVDRRPALVLRSAEFRKAREASWRELDDLVTRVEKRGISAVSAADLQRMPLLYRTVLSSLSVARSIALDRGRLDLITVDGFRRMLPEIPIPSVPFIGAFEIRVASLAALRDLVRQARLETFERAKGLIVKFPPEIGQGAWLFTE